MTEDAAGPLTEVVSKEEEAPLVAEKVKVLCWIMTGPKTHQTKVRQGFNIDGPLECPISLVLFIGPTREGDLGVSV